MPGFDTGSVMYALNVDFTGNSLTSGTAQVTQNGQLLIGNNSSPQIRVGRLTSPNGTITIGYVAPNITLDTNGLNCSYTNVTNAMSPYTVLPTDCYISVDCSGGAVTLKFPDSPTFKQTWIIKDRTGKAAVSNISLTTVSGARTFDGLTTYVMNSNFQAINLLANNSSNYEVY